ncbi:MAG: hypothetical protein U1E76_20145 [Planctomycetota bacterium]
MRSTWRRPSALAPQSRSLELGALYLGIVLGSLVIRYRQQVSMNQVGQRVIQDIRQQLFAHIRAAAGRILRQEPASPPGHARHQRRRDAERAVSGVVTLAYDVAKIVMLIVVIVINPRLSRLRSLFVPVMAYVSFRFSLARRARRTARTRAATARVNAFTQEIDRRHEGDPALAARGRLQARFRPVITTPTTTPT